MSKETAEEAMRARWAKLLGWLEARRDWATDRGDVDVAHAYEAAIEQMREMEREHPL